MFALAALVSVWQTSGLSVSFTGEAAPSEFRLVPDLSKSEALFKTVPASPTPSEISGPAPSLAYYQSRT